MIMEKKKVFLEKFIRYGGRLELSIAVVFFCMGYIEEYLKFGTHSLPLFYQFAAVELLILGYLLWYSARDIERYTVIIVASCVFRFIMPAWPELQAIITLWPNPFAFLLLCGMVYDIASAVTTLIIMNQLGYLKKK